MHNLELIFDWRRPWRGDGRGPGRGRDSDHEHDKEHDKEEGENDRNCLRLKIGCTYLTVLHAF